jgi:hypothetical protein
VNRPVRLLVAVVTAGLVVSACGDGDAGDLVATFQTVDSNTFKVAVNDPEVGEALRVALGGDGRAGIPNGRLRPGDGGVNTGHAWHMVDMHLAEVAIEVCDGTVSMVDDDVDYWINTVGQYCPWDARVIDLEES